MCKGEGEQREGDVGDEAVAGSTSVVVGCNERVLMLQGDVGCLVIQSVLRVFIWRRV
ncbi:hypothetical protein BCR35DRAFT_303845 [Leucosporidium creatinivorum]|uniref:Uncharacterized protein n=1 Tax=Leucosporidium creatinivorum TaxID=106004 RepID=A0A1Y2FEU2_9BASI|nr:hypothetical protein BCR35DRAFT_303845 [Leucosporidium creatinivorum]